jgi:hypothetical protein
LATDIHARETITQSNSRDCGPSLGGATLVD